MIVVSKERSLAGATRTLMPDEVRVEASCSHLISSWLKRGVRFVEMRDDLLTDEQLLRVARQLPQAHRALSLRRPRLQYRPLLEAVQPALVDFALELGALPEELLCAMGPRLIVSQHHRELEAPLSSLLRRLEQTVPSDVGLKLAVPLRHLGELGEADAWSRHPGSLRLLLPIASDGSGRFAFYRLVRGADLLLNFVREPKNTLVLDQPTEAEWAARHAVQPSHSADSPFAVWLTTSPEPSVREPQLKSFFATYGWPLFRIELRPLDLTSGDVLGGLHRMGMRVAAASTRSRAHAVSRIDDPLLQALTSAFPEVSFYGSPAAANESAAGSTAAAQREFFSQLFFGNDA